jgi:hypothetical protein
MRPLGRCRDHDALQVVVQFDRAGLTDVHPGAHLPNRRNRACG